ncbi:MAG: elongation factor P maturation arginine rhamnosyltransferase EarP [Betaproteobacteria bacterium]|nr:elongation factor P maturation arginine rhamnosyltransferase EarP [Betaproteobacteria bacterium]
MKRWDIFCKIVDNFGDIGVCWRLARQLQHEHHLNVRLWVDDLLVAQQLIPELDTSLQTQTIAGIIIAAWQPDTQFDEASEVVVEAFGCDLPEPYQAKMHPHTRWINLEYLSAEPWVQDFHARHSKRGSLTRYFFFPGFNLLTGGLIRESDIVLSHQQYANYPPLNKLWSQALGTPKQDRLNVSLFCYPHAPIQGLLTAMADANQETDCYVPASKILSVIGKFFNQDQIEIGDTYTLGNLHVHVIPFLRQQEYDQLLVLCDINFVRGEDSWVRAIWAGKPFIWQPYLQTEQAHLSKLNAFLDTYYADCEPSAKVATYEAHRAWCSSDISASVWQNYISHRHPLQNHSLAQCDRLTRQTDLASNLVIFSEKIQNNQV